MKKIYNSLKLSRNIIVALTLILFLITGGCYTIAYIEQDEVIAPNSAFNVQIAVKLDEGIDASDFTPGYGIIGVFLPEGWKVKDPLEYRSTGFYGQNGYYSYNSDVVSFLNAHFGKPAAGYYWWGAKSFSMIDIVYLDTGYVNLTIITDGNMGQFKIKYVLGDDNDWHKSSDGVPYGVVTESAYIPLTVDLTSNAGITTENEEFEVFPNPATTQVTFAWKTGKNKLNLKIFHPNGACVTDREILSYETIDLGKLPRGIYLYKLLDKKQVLKTGKLIIQ